QGFARVLEFYRDIERVCSAIAAGDLSQRLVSRGPTDRLSVAINDMAEKRQAAERESRELSEAAALEAKFESALSELSSAMKGASTVEQVAEQGLAVIVKTLSASIAAVFSIPAFGDESCFNRIATWAYPAGDGLTASFKRGTGIVGQVGESARLMRMPVGTGGLSLQLGFATAALAEVIYVPLKHDERAIGVLELAVGVPLAEKQLEWLEKAAADVGVSIRIALGRELTERALAESKAERLRSQRLLDSSPDAIVIVGADGKIDYVNKQVTNLFGYAPSELHGRHVSILIPESMRPGHDALMDSFHAGGTARVMGEGRELSGLTKDGREVPIDINLSPLKTATENLVIASIRDITARKEAEQALKLAKDALANENIKIQAIIDTIPYPVFYKGPDTRFLGFNRAYEEVFDRRREDLIGKRVLDLDYLPLDQRENYQKEDENLIRERGSLKRETPMPFSDGKIHDTLYYVTAVSLPDGSSGGLVGTFVDISELKAAERTMAEAKELAESATRAKSEFLASMSHEIRTPMNGVTGMADLLAQTKLNDDQKHMVKTIRDSGNSLITIINDILDFSKIEAGKLDLEDVSMSIADILEGVATTLTPNAVKKGIRILTFVDPNIPEALSGDP
ncbi:MAG: PAS domain S-box protein, partial [Planctomycetales bacterium]|nr:PAS domain S-box protein [Planctomycetales bacterium]